MRTPGHDEELAAGFLVSEGLLSERSSVLRIERCRRPEQAEQENVIEVSLAPGVPFDSGRFSRHVYTSSSCGICGKASIELVRGSLPATSLREGIRLRRQILLDLPDRVAPRQAVFARTGGLHAAALFSPEGELLLIREDVGRHNAVDKLIGSLFLQEKLPAGRSLLLLSGRAGFELVQKAAMAGIPILAAVGAPSSLAVQAARELGMTLVGFLRRGRFNIYSGEGRIDPD
jgi:FdhD protein